MSVTMKDFDEVVRPRLLTLDQAKARLSTTEPLSEVVVEPEVKVEFRLPEASTIGLDSLDEHEALDGASLRIGKTSYGITKEALLQATSAIGLTRQYVAKTPAHLVQPHLNYWLNGGRKRFKALTAHNNVVATTKPSISPFSNLQLVETATERLSDTFGEQEILVDYKFAHDLRKTHLRLIVPGIQHRITGREGETFSAGLQITNSIVANTPLNLAGYLFQWVCTNGMVSTAFNSGNYSRRSGQGDEVYEWVASAIDEICTGFEEEFAALDQLAQTPITGEVNETMRQVFQHFRVPLAARQSIIEEMVETDDLSMFGLMSAITRTANDAPSPEQSDHLMRIGGELVHHVNRCDSCHRFLI